MSPTFAADTAGKTGLTTRSVQRSVRRAKNIDANVRERIRDKAEIADSGTELDALASLNVQQQEEAIKMVEAGKAKTLREARTKIASRAQKPLKAPSKEPQIRAMRESTAAPTRPIGQSGQVYYEPRDQERDKAADELVQVLTDDPSRVAQIPIAKRVTLANHCLTRLDVRIDDLVTTIGGTASLTGTAKAPGTCAVPCNWSAVPEAIEEARSTPGGPDASATHRDRRHALGEAEPPLMGPAVTRSAEASSTSLRTADTTEASVNSGRAVDKVKPPQTDDAGLFAIWSNLKPNTQKYGYQWIADSCPEAFHPGEHHQITESLKQFRIVALSASTAQRKQFLELSGSKDRGVS
jgi:hypothetical protein